MKEEDMRVIGQCIYRAATDFENSADEIRARWRSSPRSILSTSKGMHHGAACRMTAAPFVHNRKDSAQECR